jgi:hypothetical protein
MFAAESSRYLIEHDRGFPGDRDIPLQAKILTVIFASRPK